jgi:isoleucyl-tRNA synthetase
MSTADFRRACRAYAEKYVDIQRRDFKRLGVLGTWLHPYKTLEFTYQANIVRALGKFVAQDMVYKGKKPVHWCTHCRTALAEAEVEYEPHTSPSIYVEFPMKDQDVSVLIWTTTPWTIPNNLAIAFHPEYEYGVYDVDGRKIIVARQLAETIGKTIGKSFDKLLATFSGKEMERVVFRHPIYDRDSPGVLGDYVTLDAGTGAVHTAPGHGADDYKTGVRYGLEIYAPLDAGGHYNESVELFAGLKVWDANPKVEAALQERGRLWFREDFDHQYPHCWRCHNPVIFMATSQWFIAMDAKEFRQRALKAIGDTRWIPAWGQARIEGMIANRPDWCISRQRAWGVPIPAMDCVKCGTAVMTKAMVDQAAAVFDIYGADAWYERPLEEFVPAGLTCASCGGTEFEREFNILDVWFDSGSSHEAVLPFREDHHWPADIYLEGSDQHRGWFHSSLLVGIGTRGRAPFNQVLTHGFVMDEHGRKMSKSLGNTVAPQDVIKQSGAEILRLWVSMVDYRYDMNISKEALTRTIEAYRKIRNVIRVLVANLYDFDPKDDAVPQARLLEIDRWALAKYADAAERIVKAYEDYDYPAIFQAANQLITVDLSAFYIDVTKDRMYTLGAKSEDRRSGQTAMFIIVDGLARLLAPVLSVTMDELWRMLPGQREESVHMALFARDLDQWTDAILLERWETLAQIRDRVNLHLEEKRKDKTIAANLSARVVLGAPDDLEQFLSGYRDFLPTLFGVSAVELTNSTHEITASVERAPGTKCERCWRYVPSVSSEPNRTGLCPRCIDALDEPMSL